MSTDTFFTVRMTAKANNGSWQEDEVLDNSRLGEPEAADMAEAHAQRLSEHLGHIQWKRWGRRTWRIWEPGEDGVDCWVRVIPDEVMP